MCVIDNVPCSNVKKGDLIIQCYNENQRCYWWSCHFSKWSVVSESVVRDASEDAEVSITDHDLGVRGVW